ncbi:MAG: thiamine-phosphate kinase [Pseudomonadota bacterium]
MAERRIGAGASLSEADVIAALRPLAKTAPARGLMDDAAVWLPPLGRELVLTHDTIAEGIHYLPADDPSDIAWKLVATNLSDLAAKGAMPAGVLLGLTLAGQSEGWIERFAGGLKRVLDEHDTALFGGDTVLAERTVLGCTAIGHVSRGHALSRAGAGAGDRIYVSGTIGDAGLGLAARRGEAASDRFLERRYRLPMPRLAIGQGLRAAGATAAMDVSDGLLIDAKRMALASDLGARIDLARLPLSPAAASRLPAGTAGRLQAATAGDDYELLFAAPPDCHPALVTLCEGEGIRLTEIGALERGAGLSVSGVDGEDVMPVRLGYEHGT